MASVSNTDITKPMHRHLHTLCLHPRVKFDFQGEDEDVILVLRQHPITQLPWIVTSFFLLFIPLFMNIFLVDFFTTMEVLFINLLIYVCIFAYAFVNILLWLYNVGVITSQRLLDVDYISIIQKKVSGSAHEEATDVSGTTSGFIRSYFNYGDVYVQTAGISQNIEFLGVPDPDEVVSLISRIIRLNKAENEEVKYKKNGIH